MRRMQSYPTKEIPQLHKDILALREEGKTLETIGSIVGLTRERVRQILLQYNVPKPKILDSKPRRSYEEWNKNNGTKIETILKKTNSISETANSLGISPARVRQYIKDNDLSMYAINTRRVNRYWTKERIVEVLKVLVQKNNGNAISPVLYKEITQALKKEGIPYPSYSTIQNVFSSNQLARQNGWSLAMKAAGAKQKHTNLQKKSRPRLYNRESVMNAAKHYFTWCKKNNIKPTASGYTAWSQKMTKDVPSLMTLRVYATDEKSWSGIVKKITLPEE